MALRFLFVILKILYSQVLMNQPGAPLPVIMPPPPEFIYQFIYQFIYHMSIRLSIRFHFFIHLTKICLMITGCAFILSRCFSSLRFIFKDSYLIYKNTIL